MRVLGRYRARLIASGLALMATWEIAVSMRARASAPTADEWKAAAAAVRASASPDALIVFAPSWIDPVGRLWLGDRISLHQAARMDAVRYHEVWEVTTRGATAPEVARETPVSAQTFGRIQVRQFIRNAPTVLWDLSDQAHVHEVDFKPRDGVLFELAHAYAQQRRLFRQVTLGTQLQVYAGLSDYRTRDENQATALLQVMIDGREVTRGYVGNDSGWLALPVAATQPGPHDVELVARVRETRGQTRMALCVAAESRIPLR